MNIRVIILATTIVCFGWVNLLQAEDINEKLAQVNAEVERQTQAIDQKYGVLLDYQERSDLKLELIAIQALAFSDGSQTLEQVAAVAVSEYGIDDETEQRKLIIKLETQATQRSNGHGGTPTFP